MESRRPRSRKGKAPKASTPSPIRRTREEVEARRREEEARREARRAARTGEEERPSPRPGRSPAEPVLGRFVAGPAAKRPLRELDRDTLAALIAELRANPRAMVRRLDAIFARPDERPLEPGDLEALIDRHGLRELYEREERENLRVLLRRSRGFEPPIRRVLGWSAAQLRRKIHQHGLEEEVRALKERTREEARADAPLQDRLELVASRAEILRDAGVLEELDARNRPELEGALAEVADRAGEDPQALLELGRRALGVDPPLWRKVVAHYGLEAEAASILGLPTLPEEPVEEPDEERRAPSRRGAGPRLAGRRGRRDRRPPPSGLKRKSVSIR